MVPTNEQRTAVELFKRAKSLKISAFSGAGKTTTLSAIGNSTQRSGLYLAFNKSIAAEAKSKFPGTVDCRTTHSLALRSLPSQYKVNKGKLFDGVQGNRVAQLLGLNDLAVGRALLKSRSLGYITAKTIQRYCQSGSREILSSHVPLTGRLVLLSDSDKERFTNYMAKLAAHLWGRMLDPKDAAPLGHDGYLKLWSLMCPKAQYDFILLDEAQDTNEAVLSVLTKQDAQLTLVGDRHQQIYEWRGAVNAMAKIHTEAESALTQSFRFGADIADIANHILANLGEQRTLIGNPSISSKVMVSGQTLTTLCRTNVGVIEVTLEALKKNERPHVVGGVSELVRMLEDVTRLKQRVPAESPDLFGFADWDEVVGFADSEEGESLRTFVTIVNQNGEGALIHALEAVSHSEEDADRVVSTGHKAKGREWASVTLHRDFEPKKHSKEDPRKLLLNEEEARLLYVASTRPQQLLVVPPRLATVWGVQGANQVIGQDAGAVAKLPPRPANPVRTKVPRPELPAIAKVVKPPPPRPAAQAGPKVGPVSDPFQRPERPDRARASRSEMPAVADAVQPPPDRRAADVVRKVETAVSKTGPVQRQAARVGSHRPTKQASAQTKKTGFFASVLKAIFRKQ